MMILNKSNIQMIACKKQESHDDEHDQHSPSDDDEDKQEPEADEKGFEETGEEASKKAKVDANATCEGSWEDKSRAICLQEEKKFGEESDGDWRRSQRERY